MASSGLKTKLTLQGCWVTIHEKYLAWTWRLSYGECAISVESALVLRIPDTVSGTYHDIVVVVVITATWKESEVLI